MPPTGTPSRSTQRIPRLPGNPSFQEPLLVGPSANTANTKPATQTKSPTQVKPAATQAKSSGQTSRPQQHNGIDVVSEELRMSPLPRIKAPLKISKLHLSDGSVAFACTDCTATGDTLAEVMQHRNATHGSKYGKKKPQVIFEPDPDPIDVVLEPRGIDVPTPDQLMEMTFAEVLSLLPSIGALGSLVEHLEKEVSDLRAQVDKSQLDDAKLANYDAMQAELVERRMIMKGSGSYEQLKKENEQLRNWKNQMIKRFSSVGFSFTEEEKDQ